ncbi:hypothetical protein [Paenibacillus lutrae]|uniref:Uncharacterized protein n=1 Tax=Paenibacillus lutrae TaxID=2078573 RepID=A0A7X3FII7_9BACL|nr:hypothetical protein [Paenibacillus lutrae]MVP00343.1 hypothetical protein [Paenibacillus lutrae]
MTVEQILFKVFMMISMYSSPETIVTQQDNVIMLNGGHWKQKMTVVFTSSISTENPIPELTYEVITEDIASATTVTK